MVQGAVNSPGPVAYTPGKNLDWYVDAAGGYTQRGDKRHPYVTQPNGERRGSEAEGAALGPGAAAQPGRSVFVADADRAGAVEQPDRRHLATARSHRRAGHHHRGGAALAPAGEARGSSRDVQHFGGGVLGQPEVGHQPDEQRADLVVGQPLRAPSTSSIDHGAQPDRAAPRSCARSTFGWSVGTAFSE